MLLYVMHDNEAQATPTYLKVGFWGRA
jgi:hypothetical protein